MDLYELVENAVVRNDLNRLREIIFRNLDVFKVIGEFIAYNSDDLPETINSLFEMLISLADVNVFVSWHDICVQIAYRCDSGALLHRCHQASNSHIKWHVVGETATENDHADAFGYCLLRFENRFDYSDIADIIYYASMRGLRNDVDTEAEYESRHDSMFTRAVERRARKCCQVGLMLTKNKDYVKNAMASVVSCGIDEMIKIFIDAGIEITHAQEVQVRVITRPEEIPDDDTDLTEEVEKLVSVSCNRVAIMTYAKKNVNWDKVFACAKANNNTHAFRAIAKIDKLADPSVMVYALTRCPFDSGDVVEFIVRHNLKVDWLQFWKHAWLNTARQCELFFQLVELEVYSLRRLCEKLAMYCGYSDYDAMIAICDRHVPDVPTFRRTLASQEMRYGGLPLRHLDYLENALDLNMFATAFKNSHLGFAKWCDERKDTLNIPNVWNLAVEKAMDYIIMYGSDKAMNQDTIEFVYQRTTDIRVWSEKINQLRYSNDAIVHLARFFLYRDPSFIDWNRYLREAIDNNRDKLFDICIYAPGVNAHGVSLDAMIANDNRSDSQVAWRARVLPTIGAPITSDTLSILTTMRDRAETFIALLNHGLFDNVGPCNFPAEQIMDINICVLIQYFERVEMPEVDVLKSYLAQCPPESLQAAVFQAYIDRFEMAVC